MAGKPKSQSTSKNKNWGGKRPGAGRKPREVVSEATIRELVKWLKKEAKARGKTIHEVLVSMIYDEDIAPNYRLKALELAYNLLVIKRTEHKIEEHKLNLKEVELPKLAEDPASKLRQFGELTEFDSSLLPQ
jgi:hypothetical protein